MADTTAVGAERSSTVTDLNYAGTHGADTPKRSGKRARAPAPPQNPTRGSSGRKPSTGLPHAAALADRSPPKPKPKPRAGDGRAAPRRAPVSNTSTALQSDQNASATEAREAPAAKRPRSGGQAPGAGMSQGPAPAGRAARAAFAADARASTGDAAAPDPAQGSSARAPSRAPAGGSGAAAGAPAPGATGSQHSPKADPGEDGIAAAARSGGAGAQLVQALDESPSTASVPTSSDDADFRADAVHESSRYSLRWLLLWTVGPRT